MRFRTGNFFSSVVARIRLGWFVITALVVLVVVASVIGLKNVQATQRTLSERAIPALEQFETVSDEVARLQAKVEALVNAGDAASHREDVIMASASLVRLDALLLGIDDFQEIIAALELSLRELDSVGQRNLKNQDDIVRLTAQIDRFGLQLSERVSRQIVDNGTELETMILAGEPSEIQSDNLIRKVSALNTQTRLGSTIASIIEQVELLPSTQTSIQLQELEGRLAFEFRGAVRDLALLPQSQSRQDLARLIGDLRGAVLENGGLVALQEHRLNIARLRDEEFQSIRDLLAQTSKRFSASVAQAKLDIGASAKMIDATVANTIFWLFVLGSAVLLSIGLATIYLAERQIIRRLGILTRSVREIASGNNDWTVSVGGADEFGEMASALEVFKRNSKELVRSNEELGRFAYAASHDLRSPLRAINDLAKWTIEDAGDVLPEDCRTNLDLMLDRTGRLSSLLDSLLDYSRVGREDASIAPVNLDTMPHDILELLGASDRFTIKVEGNVTNVTTYEAPLRQVLHNLINNAIKHHDKECGEITVSFHVENERLRVSVADDGPGIEARYHEKIFEMFQTLKSRDVVEASGMGLAIIRKHVEQLGGKLSVTSDPEHQRGTEFTFDWPLAEKRIVMNYAA